MNHIDNLWLLERKQHEVSYRYVTSTVRGIPADIARLTLFGDARDLTVEANAQRIVTCVNACHGVPQSDLDAGWSVAGQTQYTWVVVNQRNNLLLALQGLMADVVGCEQDDKYRLARAAIDSVVGVKSEVH